MTRPRRVLNISARLEAVADSPDRLDETGILGVVGELLSQVSYIDVDRAGVADVLVAPDLLHQPLAGQDDAGVGRQHQQQVELLGGQLHRALPLDVDLAALRVDGQALPLDDLRGLRRSGCLLYTS